MQKYLGDYRFSHTFNRTIVELKRAVGLSLSGISSTFNRTIVELKL